MAGGARCGARGAAGLVGLVLVALLALGGPAHARSTPARNAPARRGAACLRGQWKLDLQSLVATASITGTLSATGSVDLTFDRGKFLQTYADIISGTTTMSTGGTLTVEQKYAGAVAGNYRATARRLTLRNIDNATEMVMTVTVSGIAGAPNTRSPAPGTQTAGVTLRYTCSGSALTISSGGSVAQHYSRTG